jgi:hypothetical protein
VIRSNNALTAQFQRRYSPWLYGDPYEFALASGLLATVCCIAYLTWALVENDPSITTAQGSFLAGLFFTLAALVFSGIIRGDVSRLWIFLMPFVQVVAADFCGRFRPTFIA